MRATLAIRQAVRPWVETTSHRILVGVSGGADSMALAIGTLAEAKSADVQIIAIIIDHQLQKGSSDVALQARAQLLAHGFTDVEIIPVDVEITDGMESSARRARYAAFDAAIARYQPDFFFLAHTKNDQAESVLLGLARGSGTRSLSGIAEVNGIYIRPLLGIDRATTQAACLENSISPWEDPHNSDLTYSRVRVRKEILPLMESHLGPGIIEALARSAAILREDADALDHLAGEFLSSQNLHDLPVALLEELPKAVRIRVLRSAIYGAGAPLGALGADHLAPVEALITNWHGQGEISLPGGVKVLRISGRLSLSQQIS
jgi:tRNA(Ile)-lysidine synthase